MLKYTNLESMIKVKKIANFNVYVWIWKYAIELIFLGWLD